MDWGRSGARGDISSNLTDELPGKYAMRPVRDLSGLEVWVFDNERLRLTGLGTDEWSVVASRCYQGIGFIFTHLIFPDPPPQEFTDRQALDLLLGYKSFAFGERSFVIFCPPRAQVTWEGGLSTEPITDGECKADATLTIALDKRTPSVLKARLLKVERGMARILVDQTDARK